MIFRLKKAKLVLAVLFSVLLVSPALADAFQDTAQQLKAKSYSAKIKAVNALAKQADARAVPLLDAMVAGNLFTSKKGGVLVIAEKSGGVYLLTDPFTGKELGQSEKNALKKVRVNNKLRRIIRGALGGLTLFSPDPEKRLKAAHAVFKSRPKEMMPILEKAWAQEKDETVEKALVKALAANRLVHSSDTDLRVKAATDLAGYTSADVKALLSSITALDAKGQPIEKDEMVRDAAQDALKTVEDMLSLYGGIKNVFFGLSLGSVLLLAAIGLAITFGVMGVINMAHGEMVMLGAYTTFIVQSAFRTYIPDALDYSLIVAIPAAFMVAGAFGIAIERGVIRFLYGRPLETLLATWGVSLMLQQLMRTIFGPTNQEVSNPSWMSGALEITAGLSLTYNRIWIIAFSLLVLGAIGLLLRRTDFGLQMRAVTQNRSMAGSMGIRTGRIDALTFGLGSGVAGMAGVALSQIDNVSPNLGQAYIIDSFMVVVFGGVGNLWGTLVGAFSLGFVNKFLEPYSGAVLAKILVLVAIILFIQKRPRGLFALKGRAVEA
jgi:urea transport system permease protein